MEKELLLKAKNIRLSILKIATKVNLEGKGAHIGPSLSMVEILTTLFSKNFKKDDVFILSKGHGGLGYYAALREFRMITDEQFESFESNGGDFPGQPSKLPNSNIVFSSGSLGMGLSYGCGMALVAKRNIIDKNIYVLVGDGELNEGSNWEAIMFAKQHNLDNLYIIVDYNKMQSDGITSEILNVDLEKVFRAFDCFVNVCDGHSICELDKAFKIKQENKPNIILANTIKGKGISFMENNTAWHHSRLNEKQYLEAIEEVKNGD